MTRRTFTAILAASACSTAPEQPAAEAPAIVETALFQAGEGGYAHYRIPAVVATPSGAVLVFTEARKSTGGDWGVIDILMRRSLDGGRTFEPALKFLDVGEVAPNPVALAQDLDTPGETTYNNFAPIVDAQGSIHALFCVEYARAFYTRSDDDGLTWTDPVDITATFETFRPRYDWRVIATGPGHGIELASGRLLVPIWMSTGTGGHAHRPSAVSVVYSDNGGKTWEAGEIAVEHPDLENPSETVAVELTDGRILLNIRHEGDNHRRAVIYSDNGVDGWTEPAFDEALREPVCMASMIRLPGPGDRILFANPDADSRRNLTVRLSENGGLTWPVRKVIEPESAGYSDLAVGPDGQVYLFYEKGRVENRIATLTLATFEEPFLTQ